MVNSEPDTTTAKTMGWLLGIGLGLLFGGPIAFAVALAFISGAYKLADWTHLPVALAWALIVIYTGVGLTAVLRWRTQRNRRTA